MHQDGSRVLLNRALLLPVMSQDRPQSRMQSAEQNAELNAIQSAEQNAGTSMNGYNFRGFQVVPLGPLLELPVFLFCCDATAHGAPISHAESNAGQRCPGLVWHH